MSVEFKPIVRCVSYERKSSEDGLDHVLCDLESYHKAYFVYSNEIQQIR